MEIQIPWTSDRIIEFDHWVWIIGCWNVLVHQKNCFGPTKLEIATMNYHDNNPSHPISRTEEHITITTCRFVLTKSPTSNSEISRQIATRKVTLHSVEEHIPVMTNPISSLTLILQTHRSICLFWSRHFKKVFTTHKHRLMVGLPKWYALQWTVCIITIHSLLTWLNCAICGILTAQCVHYRSNSTTYI